MAAARRDAVPQRAAGDQRGLEDLGVTGGELGRVERLQQARVGEHGDRLVIGADVVLGLGQVDPGLAAVGGIDLGDERGRHLDHADAALVGRRAEAGEVADDPAAEGHDVVCARGALPDQRVPDALGRLQGLVLLAGRDLDEARGVGDARAVERGDGLVADHEPAPGRRATGARSSGPTQPGSRPTRSSPTAAGGPRGSPAARRARAPTTPRRSPAGRRRRPRRRPAPRGLVEAPRRRWRSRASGRPLARRAPTPCRGRRRADHDVALEAPRARARSPARPRRGR